LVVAAAVVVAVVAVAVAGNISRTD